MIIMSPHSSSGCISSSHGVSFISSRGVSLRYTIAVVVPGRIRERTAEVMDREHVRPVACLLVDEEWVKHVTQERGVEIYRDRVEGKDDIDCLDVAVT